MNAVNRFFWFCSGADIPTLQLYRTEHNKYTGIGATIFFTGLFAALSGGYAMYFVFHGVQLDWLLAIIFGIIWGLAIFNTDRYIVSTIRKNSAWWRQIIQALPRLLLAVMIGLVISRPLELRIFDKEIRENLADVYMNRQRARIDTATITFNKKYNPELNRLANLIATKDSAEAGIKSDRQKLNFEIFGTKTTETSGNVGYGPYAKRKEAELVQRQAALDTLNQHILTSQAFIDRRRQAEGLIDQKIYTKPQLDSLTAIAGFADRNHALSQLGTDAKGKPNESTQNAITFIGLLFIVFECLPVIVKLLSAKGPYDDAITSIEDTESHAVIMQKDHDIAVADNTYQHKLNHSIDLRKHEITHGSSRA